MAPDAEVFRAQLKELVEAVEDTVPHRLTAAMSRARHLLADTRYMPSSADIPVSSPEHFGGAITGSVIQQMAKAQRKARNGGLETCVSCGHWVGLHADDAPSRPCTLTTRDDEGWLTVCDCDAYEPAPSTEGDAE